jgi:hypothetical protein
MQNESPKKNSKMQLHNNQPSTKQNISSKVPEGAKRIGNYILGTCLFKK